MNPKPPGYKGTGRPTKLTPALQTKICQYIADGNYLVTACSAVGIDPNTFNLWLNNALKEESNGGGMYFSFMVAVKEAEAKAEAELASMVRKTALQKKDWLPAITFLERRHRERWGRPAPIGITVEDNRQVNITHVEYNLGQGYEQPGQVVEGEARELLEEGHPLVVEGERE